MANKWNRQTTLKFIREFKSHEFLWDSTAPMFNDRQMRNAAMQQIVDAMNIEGFGVVELRTKVKNLRSTYCQELKKVEHSKNKPGGKVYVSKLKWLKEFEPIHNSTAKRVPSIVYGDDDQDEVKPEITQIQIPNETTFQSRKKFKISSSKSFTSDVEEDTLDVFGKSVAMQLKNMTQERALLAQSAIQKLLTEFGIEDLKENNRFEMVLV